MKKASQHFSEEDRKRVNDSVTEAEKKTSGEIVAVVATASGRYDRAEDVFGLLAGIAAVALAWLLFQDARPESGDWASGSVVALGLLPILLILAVATSLGTLAAQNWPVLRQVFVPRRQKIEEVERAAADAFHRFRVRDTEGSTGIMIYASLAERMVHVMGDQPISEKIEQSDWDEICRLAVEGLRSKLPTDGLCQAIAKAGDLLARDFPIAEGDANELTNELRFLD